MSSLTVKHVRIAGIAACVPKNVEENFGLSIFKDEQEARRVISSTGIKRRHIVDKDTTASDLAFFASEHLIKSLGWEKESIDILMFVSQTRDYIAPQTACILQHRIGLSQGCCAFDVPLGCSGFVHGMSILGSMVSQGGLKRALLINAETNSRNRSSKDRTVKPLFGDAATVTALEYDNSWEFPMNFVYGVDGSGYNAIWTKYGGMRYPTTVESLQEVEVEDGVVRKGTDMVVNGMDVFSFAIKRPAQSLRELISTFRISIEEIDLLLLHQANLFIDEKIRKSINFPVEKVPYCIEEFGNVTSASIPLTMVTQCSSELANRVNHCIACGFGVGLEWASMEFWAGILICPDILYY